MSKNIQPIRGMNDILPAQSVSWQHLESIVRNILQSYGYSEIRLPVLERTELFARSIGEVTDIVEKEMYSFDDRNGVSLSLRPEATAGCVRAGISNGLLYNQVQRLWCSGPMFRYERPQKGRYRQFHQIDVEAFGLPGPDIDAELIAMSARFWRALGIKNVTLQLNSLGSVKARAVYRELLVEYFSACRDGLDEDSLRRLQSNPMRILDSKNPAMQATISQAPSLIDHLDNASKDHFAGLCSMLDDAGIGYSVNPRLVRGLDYYTRTVFEWVTDSLGAQDAVCSGGRYDGLVEHLGGPATPAIGFAMGVERLIALMEAEAVLPAAQQPDIYFVLVGEAAEHAGFRLTERLRDVLPALRIVTNCGGGAFRSQLKRADKSGARYALVMGDDEVAEQTVGIKPLRTEEPQVDVPWDRLETELRDRLTGVSG